MSGKVIFAEQTQPKVDGISKHIVRYESNAMVTCCSETGGFEEHTYNDIIEGLNKGRVEANHAHFGLPCAELRANFEVEMVSNLPIHAQKKLLFKQAYCDALLELLSRGDIKRTEQSLKDNRVLIEELVNKLFTTSSTRERKKYACKTSFCV